MVPDITLSPQPHPSTRREDGVTTLMAAAFAGNLAMVRDLVERRADVNAADSVGYTALMYAANASHLTSSPICWPTARTSRDATPPVTPRWPSRRSTEMGRRRALAWTPAPPSECRTGRG
jgi:hypothetical protein